MSGHAAMSQPDGHADTLRDQVIEEIAAALDLAVEEVTPGCALREDFGCRPIDFDALRWAFEQRWGFAVPIHAVPGWRDVGSVVRYISMRLGEP